jgi:peptide/nickel transport system substrate-binding protein
MSPHLRRPGRRRPSRLLASLLTVAALAATAACGGGSTPPAAGSTADASLAGATVNQTDTLRLALSRQLTGVNPHKGGSPDSSGAVIGSVYESLTRITADAQTAPGLATAWTNSDPLTWTATIRTDRLYSDGTPLTADDIVWNFATILDPDYKGTIGAPIRKYLTSVEKVDDQTVTFHLSVPALDFPGRLWSVYIVKPEFAQTHNLETESLGSGPYVIDSLDLENGVQLSLNPHWTGDRPAFDKVSYTVLASEAQRVAALQAGEQDIALNLEPLSLDQFADSPNYDTIIGVGPQPLVLAINERKTGTPLADARVRQALNYATDKQGIITGILKDSVEPLPGQVLFEPFQTPVPGVTAYEYDPDKAKALLAEAGYADGFTVEVDVPSGTYVSAELISQAIAAQWAQIGVTLTITTEPFPAWLQRQYGADDQASDLVYIMWGGQYRDGYSLFDPFRSDHIQSHVKAPEFDALVLQAQAASDPTQQRALVGQAVTNYRDEAHTVFLYPSPFTAVVSKAVTWTPKPSRYLYAQEVGRA